MAAEALSDQLKKSLSRNDRLRNVAGGRVRFLRAIGRRSARGAAANDPKTTLRLDCDLSATGFLGSPETWRVGKAIGNVNNTGPQLAMPV